ncbi:MAG: glycosyltransferase family 2 protein [Bacteroidetes bacterium]|nr:glycosyltransferase family 2 protein [Bacteroidota bacterium]
MKVSGFTFVRNAIKYDYPVVESIRSILPVCDEFIVAVGHSEDDTRNLVLSIGDPKIRIIDTICDDSLREGGKVLAIETNKAFDAISPDSDWAFYIQADEVVHERYLPVIRAAMEKWQSDPKVEGLVFNYTHFWGSYQYIGDSRRWYRREVRIIRNDKLIRSYLDAQGFRKEGRKLLVAPVNAFVYHYGWVKPPRAQQAKQQTFHRYWHPDRWIEKTVSKSEAFDYTGMDFLKPFTASHPRVMHDRIDKMDWKFTPDHSKNKHSIVSAVLHFIEMKTGWRIGEYRNYILHKKKKD